MTKLYLTHHFSAEISVMVNHLVFSVGVQIISTKKKKESAFKSSEAVW